MDPTTGRLFLAPPKIAMPVAVDPPVAAMMDDVKGFILDEQRTVTYKWLSSSLSVSADVAKRSVRPPAMRCSGSGDWSSESGNWIVILVGRPMGAVETATHAMVRASGA